jgi:hypothetical protein
MPIRSTGALPNPHGWRSHHRLPQAWVNKEKEMEMTPEERLLVRRKQATERQRRHRARLRNDPQKLLEVKERQKMYAQKRRLLMHDQIEKISNQWSLMK